jgi:hypothetical protein
MVEAGINPTGRVRVLVDGEIDIANEAAEVYHPTNPWPTDAPTSATSTR